MELSDNLLFAGARAPLVIHVPHASVWIPPDLRAGYRIADLDAELLRMTDAACDELFCCGCAMVRFPVSRLVCDPERFLCDADEPMAARGMGLAYTRTADGRVLREVTPALRRQLEARYYAPHHARLTAAVADRLARCGRCLVLDGHSFAPVPLPYEDDQNPDRPDFCLGTDPFHTPAALAELARRLLAAEGFRVALNRPFAGALVPMRWYRRDARVAALMIEVNRRLYQDARGRRTAGFDALHALLTRLAGALESGLLALPAPPVEISTDGGGQKG